MTYFVPCFICQSQASDCGHQEPELKKWWEQLNRGSKPERKSKWWNSIAPAIPGKT